MAESYTVELVEDWTGLNARNNPIDGYRISFITTEGYRGFIFIERSLMGTEAVEEAITTEADRIRAVYNL